MYVAIVRRRGIIDVAGLLVAPETNHPLKGHAPCSGVRLIRYSRSKYRKFRSGPKTVETFIRKLEVRQTD